MVRIGENTVLGPYRLVRCIGRGGMAEVYEAFEETLQRSVAVKVMSREFSANLEAVDRLKRESQILAQIKNPHVVTVYTYGTHRDIPFIGMELVNGEPLAAVMNEYVMSVKTVLTIMRQAMEGLKAIHDKGIVHHDIKPANIVIEDQMNVKIIDFGVSRSFGRTDMGTYGTTGYIAPELFAGKMATLQSDIWALGITFFELVTGSKAVQHLSQEKPISSDANIVMKFMSACPLWAPPELRDILKKMCEAPLEKRYSCMAEVIEDFSRIDFKKITTFSSNDGIHRIREISNYSEVEKQALGFGLKVPDFKIIAVKALGESEEASGGEEEDPSDRTMLLTRSLSVKLNPLVVEKATRLYILASKKEMSIPRTVPEVERSQRGFRMGGFILGAGLMSMVLLGIFLSGSLREETPPPKPAVAANETAAVRDPAAAEKPAVNIEGPPKKTAPLPDAQIGDSYIFGRVRMTATEKKDGLVKWVYSNGSEFWTTRSGFFGAVKFKGTRLGEGYNHYDIAEAEKFFPLEVGKTKTLWVKNKNDESSAESLLQITCTVEMIETIQVPAGEFETFRVKCTDMRGVVNKVYWYSAELGHFVQKYLNYNYADKPVRSTMKLKSFKLAGEEGDWGDLEYFEDAGDESTYD